MRALLASVVREGWIIIVVNFNTAIFFGLVLLTAGFGEQALLQLLAVQCPRNRWRRLPSAGNRPMGHRLQ